MNILQLFQSRSRFFYFFLVLSGLVSSLANIGIIMFINLTISGKTMPISPGKPYIVFIALILISYAASSFFQNYLVVVSNHILFDLELSIIQKVRGSTYQSFEGLGSERIYGAILDTRVLSRIPEIFVNIINAFITIVCALVYLFYYSWQGGVAVLVLMVSLFLLYLFRNARIEKDLKKVRDLQDTYYNELREMIDGFKQLRISERRNANLFNNHILKNRTETRGLSISSSKKYISNELIGIYSWYFVLGFVIFILPLMAGVDRLMLATFVTTVLFMIAPVSQLIMFFPFYSGVKIAIDRITGIDKELENFTTGEKAVIPEEEFQSIRFEGITYRYIIPGQEASSFEMPPLTLELNKGQIIFIVGGNGSGKSTFINLLTGLYKPSGGKVFINEAEVDWDTFAAYSNNMSVVYTNHHLFKGNYDEFDLSGENRELEQLKAMLNLEEVLRMDPRTRYIDTRLSKGQQKRVALLLGLLENKPILVLDEWAAEQDPPNRKNFYIKWIEKIRSMGKTIIIVSHDDEFYHKADRVIKFNYGKIVSDTCPIQEPAV